MENAKQRVSSGGNIKLMPRGDDKTQTKFALRKEWIPIAAYFLLSAIYFNQLLFSTGECISSPGQDISLQFFRWRYFGFSRIAEGVFPFWNPHIFAGTPFFSNPQSALLYPLNILYLVFPTCLAINISSFFHLGLSGWFCYLLARWMKRSRVASFLAGFVYAFCAPQIMHLYAGHVTVNCVLPWIPLIIMLIMRIAENPTGKKALAASLVFAVAFLAGHPQYIYYMLIAVALFWLYRWIELRRDKKFLSNQIRFTGILISVMILGMLLSAVQILPTMSYTRQSIRAGGLSMFRAGLLSLPPRHLITFIAPWIFGSDIGGNYTGMWNEWEMTAYCGIITVLLAFFSLAGKERRKTAYLWLLIIVGLVLALGNHTPLFSILYHALPGYRMFRGHAKAIILVNLALGLLGAFGFDALMKKIRKPNIRKTAAAIIIGIVILELGIYAFSRRAVTKENVKSILDYNTSPGSAKEEFPNFTKWRNGRVLTLVDREFNSGHLSGRMEVAGYDSNQLLRYQRFMNATQGLPLDTFQISTHIKELNYKFLVPLGIKTLILPGEQGGHRIETVDAYEGLVWTHRNIQRVKDSEEALGIITEPGFDFFRQIVIESEDTLSSPGSEPEKPDRVKIVEWDTNTIRIRADVETSCYLLFSNVYRDGWNCRFMDEESGFPTVFPANYILQSVFIPAGEHTIVFYYKPPLFTAGMFISILTLISFIIYAGIIFSGKFGARRKGELG